jgi:hypothetical protein
MYVQGVFKMAKRVRCCPQMNEVFLESGVRRIMREKMQVAGEVFCVGT